MNYDRASGVATRSTTSSSTRRAGAAAQAPANHHRRRARRCCVAGRRLSSCSAAAARRPPRPRRAARAQQLPAVTVIVPGRRTSPAMISATGSLAARRDMPVGVAGEGGQVDARAGRAGPVGRAPARCSPTIDRSVQAQTGGAARRPDRGRARRCCARAEPISNAPSQLVGRGFVCQGRPRSQDARPAMPPPRASASPRRSSARPARRSAGSTSARRPPAWSSTRSVEAGQVVSAGSRRPVPHRRGRRDGTAAPNCRRPISPRLHVGVPATVTPVGSTQRLSAARSGRSRRSSIRRPARASRASRVPYDPATCARAASPRPRSAPARSSAPLLPEIGGAERRRRAITSMIVGANNKVERRAVKIGTVTDRGVVDRRGPERHRAGRAIGGRVPQSRARRSARNARAAARE